MEPLLVYFSSLSLNTYRFVEKVGGKSVRIPLSPKDAELKVQEPYVLVCPTYSGNNGENAVPKQVIRFLNDKNNRQLIRGVIAAGNTNFGKYYGYAGTVISKKCNVPFLYKFELMGTPEDVVNVQNGVNKLWISLKKNQQLMTRTGT